MVAHGNRESSFRYAEQDYRLWGSPQINTPLELRAEHARRNIALQCGHFVGSSVSGSLTLRLGPGRGVSFFARCDGTG